MRISDWSSDVCSSDLRRDDALLCGRPGDADGRVVPADAAAELRPIGARDLVEQLGVVGERLEAMREAGRRIEHQPVLLVEPRRQPAARSEERRVGKARDRTCRSRWSPYPKKKK